MKKQGLYQLLIGALAVAPLGCDKKSERAIRAEAVANSQASAEPPAISVVEVPQTSGAASAEASVVQAVKPRPVEKSQPPARQRAPVPKSVSRPLLNTNGTKANAAKAVPENSAVPGETPSGCAPGACAPGACAGGK
ncbi:MAG: hypothetical protein HRU17_13250 [Polyangiaceae bacterium]|nr:hypothetical protein [Polyangiaceae bacterium]